MSRKPAPNNAKANAKAKYELRFNAGKLRVDLIPWEWIYGLAALATKGAIKYAPRNWEQGGDWSNPMASLKRHLLAWERGEDYDKETGAHHLVAVAFNALELFSWQIRRKGKQNFPRKNYKGVTADE